jgi:hypothetical protein
MTPEDCRAKVDQYFQRVHGAQTSYERGVYLKLAQAWLEAALVNDAVRPAMPPAPRLQLAKLSGSERQMERRRS